MSYNTRQLEQALADLARKGKNVRHLVDTADARRMGRSEDMDVMSVDEDDRGDIRGKVQGLTDEYDVHIIPVWFKTGGYKFRCSCPDHRDRCHQVGPCKHTLAVAQVWLEEARGQYRMILDARDDLVEEDA